MLISSKSRNMGNLFLMLSPKFMKDFVFWKTREMDMMRCRRVNLFKVGKEGWMFQSEFSRFWRIRLIDYISGKYK